MYDVRGRENSTSNNPGISLQNIFNRKHFETGFSIHFRQKNTTQLYHRLTERQIEKDASSIRQEEKRVSAYIYAVVCEGQLSAKGTDLTLAAAPLAAGIGQAHNDISTLAVSFAKGFQDFLSNERASWSAKHILLFVFRCKTQICVPLEDTLHHGIGTKTL